MVFLLHHCILLHPVFQLMYNVWVTTNHTDITPNHLDVQYVILLIHVLTSIEFICSTVYSSLHASVQMYSTSSVCLCMDRPTCSFERASRFYLQSQSRPPGHRTASQRPCIGIYWKTSTLSLFLFLSLSLSFSRFFSLSAHSSQVITWPTLLSAILCTQEHTVSQCLLPQSISD